jgi:hypothetical protein
MVLQEASGGTASLVAEQAGGAGASANCNNTSFPRIRAA